MTDDAHQGERAREEALRQERWWQSIPTVDERTAVRVLDENLVCLGPSGLVVVAPPASVIARFFDGEATLAELAEDFADAGEVSIEQARALVARTAAELQARSVVRGVPPLESLDDVALVSDQGVAADGESDRTEVDGGPEDLSGVRIEHGVADDGSQVVTEHLPDGSRRVTVSHQYSPGQGDAVADDVARIAEEVFGGRRSVAELVPAQTCLGQKLRIDGDAVLVNIRCDDGLVRSVRSDDLEVVQRLRDLAGDRADDDERGPVEVFVTKPFEGDGPRRVYDGEGARRGRPRTTDDVVALAGRLLAEATVRDGGAPEAISLGFELLLCGDVGLLVPGERLDHLDVRRSLRAAGWIPTGARAVLREDDLFGVPSVISESLTLPIDSVRFGDIARDEVTPSMLLPHLVQRIPPTMPPAEALDRLVRAARAVLAPAERDEHRFGDARAPAATGSGH